MPRHLDYVHPRLVLVQAVEHDLSGAFGLVGEFDFGEAEWFSGPVCSKVRRVWMHVHGVVRSRLCFASSKPLAVHVLPSVVVDLNELQKDGIHCTGVKAGNAGLNNGKHPASIFGDDHLICKFLKLVPQSSFLESD